MMRINFEEAINEDEYQEEQNHYDVAKARKAVGGLFADEPTPAKVAIDVLPADLSDKKDEIKKAEKVRSPKSRYVFTEDGLKENLERRNKYDHIEIVHHDDPDLREVKREAKKTVNQKPSAPPKRKLSNSYAAMEGDAGVLSDSDSVLSSAVKWIAIVLAAIFLVMLVFLIARNNMLSRQLETASIQVERVAALEQDLSQARIDLEIATENLAYAESQLEVLTLVPPPAMNGAAVADEYSAYGTYETYHNYGEQAVAAETPRSEQRTHVVVSGDNLSRIAAQFFGNATYANIQSIREANNLTNDVINVGQVLVIPN